MSTQVSARKPFGLATNVRPMKTGDLILRWTGGEGPFESTHVTGGGGFSIQMEDNYIICFL